MQHANTASAALDLDRPLELPSPLAWRVVDETYLFIAPLQANWLPASNQLEATLLMALSWGETPRAALRFVQQASGATPETLQKVWSHLWAAIERRHFYASAPVQEPAPAHTPRDLLIYLTRSCNLRCPQCYVSAGPPLPDELDAPGWHRALDRYVEFNQGPGSVCFSGGEPLLRPDLWDIAAHAKKQGHYLMLLTNGTLIESQETAHRLGRLFDLVQCSLDGATDVVHDASRGAGSLQRVLRALHLLQDAGVRLRLTVTFMPHNVEDLAAHLVDLLSPFGEGELTVALSKAFAQGRAAQAPERFVPQFAVAQEAINAIQAALQARGWADNPSRKPCARQRSCGYGSGLCLDANGDIHPCLILDQPIGNIQSSALADAREVLDSLYATYSVDHLPQCAACDLRYICGGGCRMRNLQERGDMRLAHCTPEFQDSLCRELIKAPCSLDATGV